jgi:hypothetical protein
LIGALSNEEDYMPAIASLDELKAAQQDLLQAKDLDELKAAFKKWRRIGWKNISSVVNRRPGIMLSIPSPVYHSYASNPL